MLHLFLGLALSALFNQRLPTCPAFQAWSYLSNSTQLHQKELKSSDPTEPDGYYYAIRNRYWLYFYDKHEAPYAGRRQQRKNQSGLL